MAFNIRTVPSDRKYYLVEAILNDKNAILTDNQVDQMVRISYEKFFGKAELVKFNMKVDSQGGNKFILSVCSDHAIMLRTVLSLGLPDASNIRQFHVLSESSFLQSLLHNSRFDFLPML